VWCRVEILGVEGGRVVGWCRGSHRGVGYEMG